MKHVIADADTGQVIDFDEVTIEEVPAYRVLCQRHGIDREYPARYDAESFRREHRAEWHAHNDPEDA